MFLSIVRLTGSDGTHGDVEIFDKVHRRWRAVCDDGWNLRSATVVCRQLNLGPPISIYSHSAGRLDNYDYGIESVTCEGIESNIAHCSYTTNHDCYGQESAGVICSPSKFSIRIHTYTKIYVAIHAGIVLHLCIPLLYSYNDISDNLFDYLTTI